RGSITRPWHSLSTLRPVHCCTRTQDSLPAVGHSTGRAWLPAGFRRKVSSCFLHLFPLSQAFLAQCQFIFPHSFPFWAAHEVVDSTSDPLPQPLYARDVARYLALPAAKTAQEKRRQSGRVGRWLQLLRTHGLIKKLNNTR